MKLSKTKIGLVVAVIYLGIFAITVFLTLFDNREGCGTLFPGMVTLPWSLVFKTIHNGTQPEMVLAMLLRLPGALLNAGIIYYAFKSFDKSSKNQG